MTTTIALTDRLLLTTAERAALEAALAASPASGFRYAARQLRTVLCGVLGVPEAIGYTRDDVARWLLAADARLRAGVV